MRKIGLICGVLVCVVALCAASDMTPLKVKTGHWETTSTIATRGMMAIPPDLAASMTPEQRAQVEAAMKRMGTEAPHTSTYSDCVTKDDLTRNPFQDKEQKEYKCDQREIKSNGSHLEAHEVCSGEGVQADVHVTVDVIDSEHTKGTVQVAASEGGHTMNTNSQFTSKWVGAECKKEDK